MLPLSIVRSCGAWAKNQAWYLTLHQLSLRQFLQPKSGGGGGGKNRSPLPRLQRRLTFIKHVMQFRRVSFRRNCKRGLSDVFVMCEMALCVKIQNYPAMVAKLAGPFILYVLKNSSKPRLVVVALVPYM